MSPWLLQRADRFARADCGREVLRESFRKTKSPESPESMRFLRDGVAAMNQKK
eukprot:CAMPEP_0183352078 /NCGR_PEP_ID=MMETSP0164_2-20130417/27378_1 /TAXON_ID=221442 /ORGANISM="Coccolithus pelagicus ssp braarudi, Strain PLY182g" /LENGTH=52 /DNA_ID=CAMNT_0025524431 /DNA_START=658 /DNA_END=813 /DNA_ORIENTATION=-